MVSYGEWTQHRRSSKQGSGLQKRLVVEAIIMGAVNLLPPISLISVVLLDAVLLIVVVFPFLYIFFFRPMSLNIT